MLDVHEATDIVVSECADIIAQSNGTSVCVDDELTETYDWGWAVYFVADAVKEGYLVSCILVEKQNGKTYQASLNRLNESIKEFLELLGRWQKQP